MRDPEGQVVGWIGSNTDIEEQKATAHALAKRTPRWWSKFARRLQSATASALSSDIMLVADFNGILTAVNPACTTKMALQQARKMEPSASSPAALHTISIICCE